MSAKSLEEKGLINSFEESVASKTFEEKLRDKRDSVPDEKVVPLFEAQDEAMLPGCDAQYQAAARQSNKALTRFVVCMGRDGFRPGGKAYHFFQYVHLDSNADFGYDKGGQVLRFRFIAMTPVVVTINGRNLLQIMDYIQLHRMPWIKVADRDYAPADAKDEEGRPRPIITSITIAEAKTGELLSGGASA